MGCKDILVSCRRTSLVHQGVRGGASRPDSSFGIFLKSASRLLPDGWVELKSAGCRGYFRTFQLELDILDTKNFGIGSVVKKLQLLEVGRISENIGKSQALMRQNPQI